MVEATDAGYAAVGVPVEGTILTVARAAADAAVRVPVTTGARARDVFAAAAEAPARRSRTPPSSSSSCARPASSTPAGAGCA